MSVVPQVCKCKVCPTLICTKHARLTRTTTDIPSLPIDDILEDPNKDEDLISPNERRPMRMLDARRQGDGELSDSDDEGEGGRRDHMDHKEDHSASASVSAVGEDTTTHKFGIGAGIMSSGQAATTGGAGPSGHTTAPIPNIDETPTTSNSRAASTAMEIDDGASASGANTGAVPSPAPAPEPEVKAKSPEVVVEAMAVDPPAAPAAPAETS